jgi:HSP20 family protein
MFHSTSAASIFFLSATQNESRWIPNADIYHSARGWLIKLDVAGVERDDISIRAEGARLFISGQRRDRAVNEDWNHYSMEIAYSRFARVIELPCDLSRAHLSAELRDGMLLVLIRPEGAGP